jgi:uncharacterized membrane protein (UPF0127 family)
MDSRRFLALVGVGGGVAALLVVLVAGGVVPSPLASPCPTPPGAAGAPTTAAPGTAEGTEPTEATATDGATTETTPDDGYARTDVVAYDANGTRLGAVEVRVAESFDQKYTGLSDTESMPEDEGMLFPYPQEDDRTFVMRGMSFGIDIVYIDSEGRVTEIHHAPEPPEGADGNDFRYPGCGQYVLEVNYNWTTRHDVDVGDRFVIEGYTDTDTGTGDGDE